MPRSRTEDTGETVDEPTVSVAVRSRFWCRLVMHHSSSVFPGLRSQFDCIQPATAHTLAEMVASGHLVYTTAECTDLLRDGQAEFT